MTSDIQSSGIALHPFDANNAQLVCSWRNDPDVRANSLDEAEIPFEAHLKFVEGLANDKDRNFFVVHIDGDPQAVLNVNRTSSDEAYWGCYLGATKLRPGLFPMLVLIAGAFAFSKLGVSVLKSDVLEHNLAPQKVNRFLGLQNTGSRQDADGTGGEKKVLEYQVHAAQWVAVADRARKVLTQKQREQFRLFSETLLP